VAQRVIWREEEAESTATHFCSLSRMKTNNFLSGRGVVGPESDGPGEWANPPTRAQQTIRGRSIN
jgi:hypothetical protein